MGVKKMRNNNNNNEGWDTIRKWTTRISKWPPWKLTLLGVAFYFGMLVLYTIVTFDPKEAQRLKSLRAGGVLSPP